MYYKNNLKIPPFVILKTEKKENFKELNHNNIVLRIPSSIWKSVKKTKLFRTQLGKIFPYHPFMIFPGIFHKYEEGAILYKTNDLKLGGYRVSQLPIEITFCSTAPRKK